MSFVFPKGMGYEKAKAFSKALKFGDKIKNHWTSEENPNHVGVFVGTKRRRGKTNIILTDMKNKFWEFVVDSDLKLEKVGSIFN